MKKRKRKEISHYKKVFDIYCQSIHMLYPCSEPELDIKRWPSQRRKQQKENIYIYIYIEEKREGKGSTVIAFDRTYR